MQLLIVILAAHFTLLAVDLVGVHTICMMLWASLPIFWFVSGS